MPAHLAQHCFCEVLGSQAALPCIFRGSGAKESCTTLEKTAAVQSDSSSSCSGILDPGFICCLTAFVCCFSLREQRHRMSQAWFNGSSKASLVQQGASRSFAFGRPGLRSLRAPSVPSQKPMHCRCTSGLLPSQRNLKWRLTARCFRESSAELRSASRGWGIVMFRIVAGTWSSLALVVALWSWWDDLGRRLAVCGGCQPLSETSLMITREMPPSAQTFGMPTRARNHKHERGMQIPAAAIA